MYRLAVLRTSQQRGREGKGEGWADVAGRTRDESILCVALPQRDVAGGTSLLICRMLRSDSDVTALTRRHSELQAHGVETAKIDSSPTRELRD